MLREPTDGKTPPWQSTRGTIPYPTCRTSCGLNDLFLMHHPQVESIDFQLPSSGTINFCDLQEKYHFPCKWGFRTISPSWSTQMNLFRYFKRWGLTSRNLFGYFSPARVSPNLLCMYTRARKLWMYVAVRRSLCCMFTVNIGKVSVPS